ncbi:MAG: DNA repair exonuclease [Pseudomonadota bacterium]
MAFSFIHTGDIHLDSPLTDLSSMNDPRAAKVAGAARRAFSDLIGIAIERSVDAVFIAGDLWDGDWRDLSAGLFLQEEAARLKAHGIALVAILGNHDAQSVVTSRIKHLDAVTLLSADAPQSVDIGGAVVHGQSYDRPDVQANLAASYPDPYPGRINIGLLHTGLDGGLGHSPYAPARLDDLVAKRYDYWALGHVHTRAILQDGPAAAGGTIAFCGVLQGRHARETGAKGAWHGAIDAGGVTLTPIDLPHVAWFVETVDVSSSSAEEAMAQALEACAATLSPALDLAVVRLVLKGESEDHTHLSFTVNELDELARQKASGIDPRFLIERVVVATSPPSDQAPPTLPHDFDGVLTEAGRSEAVREKASAELADVRAALPPQVSRALRERHPDIAALLDGEGDLAPALEAAAQAVTARLKDRMGEA